MNVSVPQCDVAQKPPEFSPESIVRFLRGIVPFNSLPQETLRDLGGQLKMECFPKGTLILEQGGVPCRYLYIIQSGAVEKTAEKDGVDILLDYRAEGEFFGSASLVSGLGPAFTVRPYEDTICYMLPKGAFENLMQAHVEFHEYFALRVSRLADRLKKAQTGLFAPRDASDTVVFRSEGYLFNVNVGALIKRQPVVCSPYHEISWVAQRMAREDVGAVVVVDAGNKPLGIVTKTDMTIRVVASERRGGDPVRTIMTEPVVTIDPTEPSFNALLKMAQLGCHHLCVVVGKVLLGVISQTDLIALQGSSPLALIQDLETQNSIEGLARIVKTMDRMVFGLLNAGVHIKDITTFISESNDRLTKKIISMAEQNLQEEGRGSCPVPYCWIALGSEGRREQTLRTDQDNAIIYQDYEAGDDTEVRKYLQVLAERVVTDLERCGFPLCKGGIMASNEMWCRSEAVWRKYFTRWIDQATPEDLRNSTIFFDFRPLYGKTTLAQRLRSFLNQGIENNRAFLRHLATNAFYNGPPLGFLRTLVVEKRGTHKNKLNLKMSGLVPMVDALRILALSIPVNATNTLHRLDAVCKKGLLAEDVAEDIRESFNFIMLLRVKHHLTLKASGEAPSDFMDPRFLSKIQRKSLIEAFHVIRDLQGELEVRFPESQ